MASGGAPDESNAAAWAQVEPLLDELMEAAPEQREARLARLVAEAPVVAAAVRELLSVMGDDAPAPRSAAELAALLDDPRAVPGRTGERMGPFRVTGELGRGGMGAVFAAERVDGGFHQEVAIKVLRRGLDSEDVLRRFLAERRILASFEHPHIVRMIDGGLTADGLPWFAMERVHGRPITVEATRKGLDVRARVELFLAVCDAVAFAHRQRVIHRDLKPSNVLLDDEGRVKLLDFGIAKLLEPAEPGLTRTAATPMTPQYAAPEQLAGEPVSTATDVWQLGRLLGELLSGSPPRDLAAIVAVASHVEPGRRYASVEALADDVRRYLDGRPITARGDSWLYRGGRYLRRHRSALLAAAVALASAAAVVVAVANRPHAARETRASGFVLLSGAGRSQSQPSISPDGSALAFVAADDRGVAQVWTRSLDGQRLRQLTSGDAPAVSPRWSRDGRIVFERRGAGIWAIAAAGGAPRRLVARGANPNLSRDGRWLVFERRGEGVWLARSDGTGVRRLAAIPDTWNSAGAGVDHYPALSPDGRQVAYFLPLAGPMGDFWRLDVDGGSPQRLTRDLAEGGTPAWTPDGRGIVVSSSRDGARTLWLLPAAGGAPMPLTVGAGDDLWPDLSADGRRLVYTTAQTAYVINLRDPRTGRDREVLQQRTLMLAGPSLSPNGDRIAFHSGSRAGQMRVFTVAVDGSDLRQVTSGGVVDHLQPSWSSDGRTLYFYEDYPSSWVVSADGGQVTWSAAGERPTFRAISAAGGKSRLLLRDWTIDERNNTRVDPAGGAVVYTRVVDGQPRATVIRDLRTGEERTLPQLLLRARWSPDGRELVGGTLDDRVLRCSRQGEGCRELGTASYAIWSADGQSILLRRSAAPLADPLLTAVDIVAVPARGGAERLVATLGPMRTWCRSFSVAPDGSLAWIAYRAGSQELWSAQLSPGEAER